MKAVLSLSTVLGTHTPLGRHDRRDDCRRRQDKQQRVVFTFPKTDLLNTVLQVTEPAVICGGAVCLLCKGGAPVKCGTFQEVLLFCVFTDTPVLPKRFPARFHSEDEVVEEPGCCSRRAEMSKDKFQSKITRYSHIPAPPTAACDNTICIINLDHRYYRNAN